MTGVEAAGGEPAGVGPTVAEFLCAELERRGVTQVFHLIGGMTTLIADAAHAQPGLTLVSLHHEQGAGFAAEGFARMTGGTAVALATSGPGATNLLTPLASCYFDSIPAVFITGQVNRAERRQPGRGRQGGFQETDIVSMASPVTVWAVRVDDPRDVPGILDRAFARATQGRPGPVLIDIPLDVQRARIPGAAVREGSAAEPPQDAQTATVSQAGLAMGAFVSQLNDALRASQRPLVLAGGGIRAAGAVRPFRQAIRSWGIPVVTSLMGLDAVPAGSDLHAGFIGTYGNRWANAAVARADLLLVLGSRLDIRQTGSDVVGFAAGRRIFQVDVDGTELGARVPAESVLEADLGDFLRRAGTMVDSRPARWQAWAEEIAARRREWPAAAEVPTGRWPNPYDALEAAASAWPDVEAFVTDVGQHQMWAAQALRLAEHQRFLTSGGLGAMGFGLPVAIGAALATPGRPVCLVAGDGGLQCNIQEFQTLARLGLPVRILVLDNQAMGMVRQFQQAYLGARYVGTRWDYSTPDFVRVAEAYGLRAYGAEDLLGFRSALDVVRREPHLPALIRLSIDPEANVYPKLAFGRPFGAMEPDYAPVDLEGT